MNILAAQKEWDKLQKLPAYHVKSKQDVISEARAYNTQVHFAKLMDLCHQDHASSSDSVSEDSEHGALMKRNDQRPIVPNNFNSHNTIMVSKAKPILAESLVGTLTKFVGSNRLSCFVVAWFLSLYTTTHVQSLHWFPFLSRWRRDGLRSLGVRRRVIKNSSRRQKSSRAGCSATSEKHTPDFCLRKDAIRCQRAGEPRPGIVRPIAFPR